jgi:two-component system LytT family response regulator
MIKAILIDDELHSVETLRSEINRNCPNIEVLDTARSGKEGIEKIELLEPDLIFLDIEMPWMSGFEMLKAIKKIDFDVIFVTAYDSYAIEAFNFSAIGYLLKPIQKDDLIAVIQRLNEKKSRGLSASHLDLLLQNLSSQTNKFPKIALATAESLEFVEVNEIIRCESDKNYTYVYLKDKSKHLLSRTLKDLENLLDCHGFIRTHQSHLVNPIFIKRFIKSEGGYLVMEDQTQIPVSRAKKEKILRLFKA